MKQNLPNKSLESHSGSIAGQVQPLALAPCSALPIPEALYPCARCAEEYSWPASDLGWSMVRKKWICGGCWDSEEDGAAPAITLKAEIARQNPSGEPRGLNFP